MISLRKARQAPQKGSRVGMAQALWLLSTFGILYGTLIPFRFHGDTSRALEKGLHALTFGGDGGASGWISLPDLLQNLMLFLPFGFFGYLVLRRLFPVAALAVLLSASVEVLQLWTLERTTSWLDLLMNSSGAVLGFLAAPFALVLLSRIHRAAERLGLLQSPHGRAGLALVLLAVMHHWHPFDFSLDVGLVWSRLKQLPGTLEFWPEKGDGLTVLHWFMGSVLAAGVMRDRGAGFPAGLRAGAAAKIVGFVAFAILSILAIGGELTQFFLLSRQPGFHDIFVALAAIAAGTALSERLLPRHSPAAGSAPRVAEPAPAPAFVAAVVAVFLAGMAWDSLQPLRFEAFHGFTWLPFAEHYARTTFATLSDAMEPLLAGLAVALVIVRYAAGRLGRMAALGICFAGYSVLEISQGWVVGRYAGTGDILALALGMWLGIRLGGKLYWYHSAREQVAVASS